MNNSALKSVYIHISIISYIVLIFLCHEHKPGKNQIGHVFSQDTD